VIIGVSSADWRGPAQSADGTEFWGATGWVRLGQWLPYWAEHHEVHHGVLWAKHDHLEIETHHPDGSSTFVTPDVVYLHLYQEDLVPVLRAAKAYGQVLVQDLDDWYWGLDSRNQAWQNALTSRQSFSANLAESHVITTSTPYLAERLAERFPADIVQIPNFIDVHRFAPVDHDVDVPTIGWVGATESRSGDLGELKGTLGQLRGQAHFQHSGHLDGAPLFADEVGLSPAEVRVRPRSSVVDYPSLLDFQIGLVPLRITPFNEAKSDLKGLEYAACGIPFVASPSGVYRDLAAAWGDCVRVAKRPADAVKSLRRLLDLDTRMAAAEELRKRVLERHLTEGVRHHLDLFASLGALV